MRKFKLQEGEDEKYSKNINFEVEGKKPEGAVRGRGDEGSGAETGKKFKIGREKNMKNLRNLKEQE